LTGHYRTQLNFTFDALDAAATGLTRMRTGFHALPVLANAKPDPGFVDRFTAFVNEDLNLPRALAIAWELLRGDRVDQAVARATLARFDDVFGLGLSDWRPPQQAIPDEVEALAQARLAARKAKNWVEADRLRAALHAAGWEMKDRADGYTLERRRESTNA
ncbi:MAG TPA: cysteine--tRNA ligase, partial [Casimicrobiaceae bacterium]|nr:cysteine--tRNA ligase [Casimicrobiaceae bacterium]